ncbi:uncharacterized protein LOC120005335 isoform X2 [Tripterygium wilfordii]|uniref:uncharacterized protein LOC120005335 isoform X2 n=1 Tax=Tripterygium wilfordii TaxID=458696 RepID=UPI0018F82EA0|nr:uncharacterized protein LOC120005335 isoform X2 [Tripterygium wilfordii]
MAALAKMIMIPTASPLISSSWSCCHGHASHIHQSNNKSLILCGTQQNLFRSAVSTNIHWRVSKRAYQPVCASGSGLEASITDPEDKALNLKDAKIVVVSQDENELELRVDLNGDETQKSFDKILRELASTAPPIPGFRRQKGGKTTQVPQSLLLQILGKDRVTNFVIREILTTTMNYYVKKENLKVKEKKVNTIQTADELKMAFVPGKEFGFNVSLELEKSETEALASSASDG